MTGSIERVHAAWRGAEDATAVCGVALWGKRFVVASPSRVTCQECQQIMRAGTTRDDLLGLLPGTIDALTIIESTVGGLGLAQRQQAFALALWRTTARHLSLRMTPDFVVDQLVLRDGGCVVRAEVQVLPPSDTSEPRSTAEEPQVTWRGSYSDLVTDLLEVLGPDGVERLCDEALPRTRVEREKLQRGRGGE